MTIDVRRKSHDIVESDPYHVAPNHPNANAHLPRIDMDIPYDLFIPQMLYQWLNYQNITKILV